MRFRPGRADRPQASRSRRRGERGYVAIVGAMFIATIGMGCAALGVDVARWYVELNAAQKAADLASLGGVTYLPQDLPSAITEARTISARNGYTDGDGVSTVTVTLGKTPSQLNVLVCTKVKNSFGAFFGLTAANICARAVADYAGPAPMGSPCNTFGNEPSSGSTSAATSADGSTGTARGSSPYSNCPANPSFWSVISGPETDKVNGDRYMTTSCANGTSTDGCTAGTRNNSGNNSDYEDAGYFWLIRVQPGAVRQPIDLQIYDPVYASAGGKCDDNGVPDSSQWSDTANPYVTDAKNRYGATDSATSNGGFSGTDPNKVSLCAGDIRPGGSTSDLMTTSFALRQQTDTQNPELAPVQNAQDGSPCIKQFRGQNSTPVVNDLTNSRNNTSYDVQLAQTYHNWYSLCTFVPDRAGDYYLQVRSNISYGGTQLANSGSNVSMISTGNTNVLNKTGNTTTGGGDNAFAIRAVPPVGSEKLVSVSGYDRMPIYINKPGSTAQFNLIRVLPGGAGKSISFSYFDVGDGSAGSGSVQVLDPSGAAPTGCKATGGYAGTSPTALTNCSAPFTGGTGGSNNGHTETIIVPIPNAYTCTYSDLSKCWYQVKVTFTATSVTDITTWTASVFGEPVRLIS